MQPPAFDVDLFISYAHIDNQPLAPDQKGWVSRFHESLQGDAQYAPRPARQAIWRDLKLFRAMTCSPARSPRSYRRRRC